MAWMHPVMSTTIPYHTSTSCLFCPRATASPFQPFVFLAFIKYSISLLISYLAVSLYLSINALLVIYLIVPIITSKYQIFRTNNPSNNQKFVSIIDIICPRLEDVSSKYPEHKSNSFTILQIKHFAKLITTVLN